MKKRSVRKRTFKERDNHLDEIHELSCRGYTQAQIGARLGLSQSQICRDLEKIAVMLSPKDATKRAHRAAGAEAAQHSTYSHSTYSPYSPGSGD